MGRDKKNNGEQNQENEEFSRDSYRVVTRQGHGEYEEKKSRFIASVAPAGSLEEAVAFIEAVKKKHYDARHNCSAFIIGRNRELTRCNDDGEPGGTAGKPMLETLLGEDVTDVVAVVTRYFGGTLLGTGGLVRAYTQATQAALADAQITTMCYGIAITLFLDYTDVGRVQYLLEKNHIAVTASRYTELVELDVQVPALSYAAIEKEITENTGGRARLKVTGKGYYPKQ